MKHLDIVNISLSLIERNPMIGMEHEQYFLELYKEKNPGGLEKWLSG